MPVKFVCSVYASLMRIAVLECVVMPTLHIETEQLLHAALQLPRSELEQFVTRLLMLSLPQDTPRLSQTESELLLKINQGLPPATQQQLDALIAKRQTQTLTPEEHQELIQLTESIEQADVERLRYLLELAALRKLSLDELTRHLGIHPVPHD
jgi:hypothetical protein